MESRVTGDATPRVDRGGPVRVEPDLVFINSLIEQAGGSFKRCIQCGTCSGTCDLSPKTNPFPRKEMAWAVWGLKDRLLSDPDVWLCHHCNDCSAACPRGGTPGEVLAAVRRECIHHYAFPRFLSRWVNQPSFIPLLLAIPAALLALALLGRGWAEHHLGYVREAGERISYAYSSELPHWLINAFFGFFSVLALLIVLGGSLRFWRAMKAADVSRGGGAPAKGVMRSILSVVGTIFRHDELAICGAARPRSSSHVLVFFGFVALSIVTLSVITGQHNPLFAHQFVYPYGFWSPWKILANLGGIAVVTGCVWMMVERLRNTEQSGTSTYSDWALLSLILLVTLTGFASEVLHYLRVEPHRHAVYFTHLVLVFALLVYLPYSKLAHLAYRTTAMIYAERTGRTRAAEATASGKGEEGEER